jgi:transcriptional regulator with XRE-family HTH domain
MTLKFLPDASSRLRDERIRLGLKQDVVGEVTGVGRHTQANYESGRTFPTTQYLERAAEIGVDAVYVLFGTRNSDVSLRIDQDLFSIAGEDVAFFLEQRKEQHYSLKDRWKLIFSLYDFLRSAQELGGNAPSGAERFRFLESVAL